jgi:tetrapyrrole methylase family protein/MazG family protein
MRAMAKRTFEELVALMTRLRGPGGCPWDRDQTFASLKTFVIEEAYEVVEAIDDDDRKAMAEEIGDLLLQAVFLAELGREEGTFDIGDSITSIHDKLVRRHPHVFAGERADSAEEVLVHWERLKQAERLQQDKSVLAGVPAALPALQKASRLTEKAARVGFDWRGADEVFAKVEEELSELRAAVRSGTKEEVAGELGDVLFTIANIARKLDVDAEQALQSTNRKFTRRFEEIEREARARGQTLDQLSLEEMDALWNAAKLHERVDS